jgi:plastocyanin
MRLRIVAGALLMSAVLLPAWARTPPGPTVHIKNFTFVPASLTIKRGMTVTFVNDDTDAHTATGTKGAFDSGGLDTHETWSHTFTVPGTFDYFCAVHTYMKGVITVTP